MVDQVVYITPDLNIPSGGIRTLYRHVELLNRVDRNAVIWHSSTGLDWFGSSAPVVYGPTLELDHSDILVVPEPYVFANSDPAPGCRKVIYNQNHFYTFYSVKPEMYPEWDPPPIMWVSSRAIYDVITRLSHSLHLAGVELVTYAIDTSLFRPVAPRQRKVAWMPRKRQGEAAILRAILSADSRLRDVHLAPLDGLSEQLVAQELGDTSIFLALGRDEGFGLPIAEALACGCLVVGYAAGGGAELFDAPGAYMVPDSDILTMVDNVISLILSCPPESQRLRQRSWVQTRYSEARLIGRLVDALDSAAKHPGTSGVATHPGLQYSKLHGLL